MIQTPRRCFERASEKCHVDSLSSIVASCSWGKHVAVGTGSRFDVLWDKKEVLMILKFSKCLYNCFNLLCGVLLDLFDIVFFSRED